MYQYIKLFKYKTRIILQKYKINEKKKNKAVIREFRFSTFKVKKSMKQKKLTVVAFT